MAAADPLAGFPAPPPANTGNGAPAPQPAAPAQRTMDPKAVETLRKALIDPLANVLAGLGDRLSAIESRISGSEGGTNPGTSASRAPANAGGSKSFVEQLVEGDSDAVINERIQQQVNARLQPYMAVILSDRQRETIAAQQARFDKRYGEGAWQAEVWPTVEKHLQESPEHLRASSEYVQSLVNAVKGSDAVEDALATRRATTVAAEKLRPASFVGAGRPPRMGGDEGEVTEDDKQLLGEFGRQGINFTEKDYQRVRTLPKEFNARMEAIKKVSGIDPSAPPPAPAAPVGGGPRTS